MKKILTKIHNIFVDFGYAGHSNCTTGAVEFFKILYFSGEIPFFFKLLYLNHFIFDSLSNFLENKTHSILLLQVYLKDKLQSVFVSGR